MVYVETSLDYVVFPHYHTQYTETFKAFDGAGKGRIGKQRVDIELGNKYVVPPRVVHGWGPLTEPVMTIVELRPAHAGLRSRF